MFVSVTSETQNHDNIINHDITDKERSQKLYSFGTSVVLVTLTTSCQYVNKVLTCASLCLND